MGQILEKKPGIGKTARVCAFTWVTVFAIVESRGAGLEAKQPIVFTYAIPAEARTIVVRRAVWHPKEPAIGGVVAAWLWIFMRF